MKTIRAWHFVGDTLRDGAPIPKDGELLRFAGMPKLCIQGLHASIDPLDALQDAPGNTLCLVDCGGTIIYGDDKLVCTERTIIARMDAEEMLRYFARMQALSVIHLCPNDIDTVVFDYLMSGDESLGAAARAAARAAAWDAAWDAARAAAAWDAAWAAAWAAAGGAAWAAAGGAAWAAARKEFNDLVLECFRDYFPASKKRK